MPSSSSSTHVLCGGLVGMDIVEPRKLLERDVGIYTLRWAPSMTYNVSSFLVLFPSAFSANHNF